MKAQELRIGNLVYINGYTDSHIERVIALSESYVRVTCLIGDIKIEVLKPISLTEEWLIKFGFEMIGMHYIKPVEVDEKGLFKENIWPFALDTDEGPGWLLKPNKGTDWVINYNRIRYVHHLQNLFYALTGKELTCL